MSGLKAFTVSLVAIPILTFGAVVLAQPAAFHCAAPSRDGTGADLQASHAEKIEPSQMETGCRGALRSDPNNPSIMVQLARALSAQNKAREAISFYLEAAIRGNVDAMNDLGAVFEQGRGVPKNFLTARMWYEKAAELGHTGAMTHMGKLSENGIEVPVDLAKARFWYERAAGLGSPAAMSNLANFFRLGRGVERDLGTAAAWYRRAADLGMPSAMNSL